MKNREDFKEYIEAFLKQNSYLNLISKNDEKFLWEKHIFDSLAIERFFEKYNIMTMNSGKLKVENGKLKDFPLSTFHFQLLDIGTGGGFPAVPIAIMYPEIEVFALDSIRKKINAIENIKAELGLKNLHTICDRAENIIKAAKLDNRETLKEQQTDKNHSTFQPFNLSTYNNLSTFNFQFDIITSRAVAPIKVIVEYAMPLLKDDGYFIAYKSIKAQEEIEDAKQVLKKHKAKVVDIIRYDLPLDENFTRNLIVIAK